ncbi:uncharacterized protein LOC112588271 [Harpegnathos saltator]|uniref:uncharacterized protein LOC112588271 n=1 Tax=Harpegnathos saltator TaxID=610380 RepID=UPI000DBEE013|nr:uncharacterized protein LOC112588271 [Harpegnathos saltator]
MAAAIDDAFRLNKLLQNINKMIRGGHSCAMYKCPNISRRIPGLSFFRFPKDRKCMYIFPFLRCRLWLRNCGRTIKVPIENLYKTYRICGNHFDSTMFLNNLKNRLQLYAVPKPMNLQKQIDQSVHDFLLDSDNHISFSCEEQDVNVMDEDNRKDQEVQIEQLSVTQDEKIQTDSTLSINSPRKIILKKKIHLLQKKLRKVKKQLKQQKASYTKKIKKLSLPIEYCDATDQIPSIASFVKAQVHLAQKSPKVDVKPMKFYQNSSVCLAQELYNRLYYLQHGIESCDQGPTTSKMPTLSVNTVYTYTMVWIGLERIS